MAPLAETRLVYIAPSAGRSGVGDYADDFLDSVRDHFLEVIEYRIATDGAETVRDVLTNVRAVRASVLAAEKRGPVIVHFEQSAGSLSTFWASWLPRRIPVTSTVHDAPNPAWWPFKTKLLYRFRLLHHAVHYPTRPLIAALQRRATRGRTLFALTSIGADNVGMQMTGSTAVASRIFVPARDELPSLAERPAAVGMFGHVYKGKGFELIGRLREQLDDSIGIVVAGRGTDTLPTTEGVQVLGEVNDEKEDAFFASFRFLIVPYSKDNPYGKVWAASSAVSRSFAYNTPIICILDGSLVETASEGGAIGVEGGIDAIAAKANSIICDEDQLRTSEAEVRTLRQARTIDRCAQPFLHAWADL
ncbi:glycosyltransferase family 1 protein [Rhodococcus fascians]|nr:glycosyltransferase family 1 protein [Rhodococcus fascians]MBY4397499.1 glycosyltransferase family 1 protein [Rhodococcus fascians]MBY4406319.1 glycosyltransferase family 1 protein [Rhodococcus fascians]MBY4422112.1 glycosyltransferase family 1 protein [Rhodococcus fascians]MBY4461607.1 glycosyltransferase family 1 protein [Rhodococcus fascians]